MDNNPSEFLGMTKSAVLQAIGKSKPPLTVLQLGNLSRKACWSLANFCQNKTEFACFRLEGDQNSEKFSWIQMDSAYRCKDSEQTNVFTLIFSTNQNQARSSKSKFSISLVLHFRVLITCPYCGEQLKVKYFLKIYIALSFYFWNLKLLL